MSDSSNKPNMESVGDCWEQSPGSSSSAPTSNSAGRSSKEIQTRISTRLVSWYALCRLGYEFVQEGETFIISWVLGPIDLEELLGIVSLIRRPRKRIKKSLHQFNFPTNGYRWESKMADRLILPMLYPSYQRPAVSIPHPVTPNDMKDSIMRPWVNQLLVSDTLSLGHIKKQARGSREERRPSDTYNAWVSPRSLLQGGEVSTRLITIRSADCYHEHARSHKTIPRCSPEPKDRVSIVRMRWL
jgi:hypothetical protein